VALHESVDVCGEVARLTLAGLRVQVKPAGVEAETVRSIVSVSPLTLVTVIVEVPEEPARICEGVTGPALMVKSPTGAVKWKLIAPVSWDSVPLVPVTVTVKSVTTVTVAVHESVAVCGEEPNVTLDGRVQVIPAGVEADTDRFTVPLKPFRPVMAMVEVPDSPELMLEGLTAPAAMLKSVTWKRIDDVSCVMAELLASVPVTITL
jgi:hypothetical protein